MAKNENSRTLCTSMTLTVNSNVLHRLPSGTAFDVVHTFKPRSVSARSGLGISGSESDTQPESLSKSSKLRLNVSSDRWFYYPSDLPLTLSVKTLSRKQMKLT